jgi:hypothetical protein
VNYQEVKDAQGQVTSDDVYQGKEVLPDGGMFEGQKRIRHLSDGSDTTTKQGRIFTPTLRGDVNYQEVKDAQGRVTSDDVYQGKEVMPNGGMFEGQKRVRHLSDGSEIITKQGRIFTPTLRGDVNYQEVKDAQGRVTIDDVYQGKEVMPDGGIFEGQKRIRRTPSGSETITKQGRLTSPTFQGDMVYGEVKDAQGRVSASETHSGKWLVSPSITLVGTVTIRRTPDGRMTITDNRTQQ